MTKKTSDAQKRATQAYRERNRERTRMISVKGSARTYVRKYADVEGLLDLKSFIDERLKELQE